MWVAFFLSILLVAGLALRQADSNRERLLVLLAALVAVICMSYRVATQ